jgi:CRISPR-associated protein (TIGR02584 family)
MSDLPKDPIEKEIFLAVMGTTPQVMTECLYYYTHSRYDVLRKFGTIKVLTTSKGRDAMVQALFIEKQIERLEQELGVQSGYFNFKQSDIIVFSDEKGKDIEDLLSSEDNHNARNQITETVRKYTDEPSCRLTATVAGGRKSMSALMALSFQLYGREQDDLIHIIPPEDRMNDKNWFFPENSDDVNQQLMVSFVPAIRVGRYLAADLSLSVDDLMTRIQNSLKELTPISSVGINKNLFTINEKLKIKIPPRGAAIYRYLLKRRLASPCEDECPGCDQCASTNLEIFKSFEKHILPELKTINGKMNPRTSDTYARWRDLNENRDNYGLDLEKKQKDFISEYKVLISKSFDDISVPKKWKDMMLITKTKPRPVKIHVGISRATIHFED